MQSSTECVCPLPLPQVPNLDADSHTQILEISRTTTRWGATKVSIPISVPTRLYLSARFTCPERALGPAPRAPLPHSPSSPIPARRAWLAEGSALRQHPVCPPGGGGSRRHMAASGICARLTKGAWPPVGLVPAQQREAHAVGEHMYRANDMFTCARPLYLWSALC